MTDTTVLGYPRIGPRRELKRALEGYWAGATDRAALDATGQALRAAAWRRMADAGLSTIPSNTFSLYDHVLDTAVLLGAVPERFRDAEDPYFAMARGDAGHAPLRMTKWFDTNYHYIVPELDAHTRFAPDSTKPVAEFREAAALGLVTRPVLVGPVTFLALAQNEGADENALLDAYAAVLGDLHAAGAPWVQLDEPALVAGADPAWAHATYKRLAALPRRPRILAATYFGTAEPLPVDAVAMDLVRGTPPDPAAVAGTTLVAGVVSGRDVWRTDVDDALARLARYPADTVVATSGSLLHVPYDLDAEPDLDPALRERLAFADQKLAEVVEIARRRAAGDTGRLAPARRVEPVEPRDGHRSPYPRRAAVQRDRLGLPDLPTTTIGSFPQTDELRRARAGGLSEAAYDKIIEAEIEKVIRLQERLGLDVLVHGEPERNDMVEYFAQRLDGFATTRHGWVQSYGSRCTRPPILHGDVRRPAPMTTRWTRFAQSLTTKPVKGMLTGPVTIVAWSFVRRDLPLAEVTGQVADAIRDEVRDLADQGTRIIQVDEPALRELLPLRGADQAEYLQWAVGAYRRATSGADDHVQIHTHLCYSNAADVLTAIDALDADVTTVESARSGGRILDEPTIAEFARGLGPGVYDIHSPRVPTVDEIAAGLARAVAVRPGPTWANPDCGLKTRRYAEVEPALANLVAAAARVRVRTG